MRGGHDLGRGVMGCQDLERGGVRGGQDIERGGVRGQDLLVSHGGELPWVGASLHV